jgi:hypothetical protein
LSAPLGKKEKVRPQSFRGEHVFVVMHAFCLFVAILLGVKKRTNQRASFVFVNTQFEKKEERKKKGIHVSAQMNLVGRL